MAYFHRYDICVAYKAIEYDWNNGGWVRERPSSQRRQESIAVQLRRIGFKSAPDEGAGWNALVRSGDINQMDIYVEALARMGLGIHVLNIPGDPLAEYIKQNFAYHFVCTNFPKLTPNNR